MNEVALQNILGENFRANPQYQLVPFDRLPAQQQEALRDLTKDPDFSGVLIGTIRQRAYHEVCRDTALLFITLGVVTAFRTSELPMRVSKIVDALGIGIDNQSKQDR